MLRLLQIYLAVINTAADAPLPQCVFHGDQAAASTIYLSFLTNGNPAAVERIDIDTQQRTVILQRWVGCAAAT